MKILIVSIIALIGIGCNKKSPQTDQESSRLFRVTSGDRQWFTRADYPLDLVVDHYGGYVSFVDTAGRPVVVSRPYRIESAP